MKKTKKIILFALTFGLFFLNSTLITFASESNSENIFSYANLESAVLLGDNIQDIIVTKEHMENNIEYIDGVLEGNEIIIKVGIFDEKLFEFEIPFSIFPSQLEYMDSAAIIGKAQDTDSFKMLSMRVEKNTSSLSLLQPNLKLEGHTVLSLALKLNNEKIYYLQIPVDEINFDILKEKADEEFAKSVESKESLMQLEDNYFSLNSASDNIRSNDKTAVSSSEVITDEDCDTSLEKMPTGRGVISPVIPDSVFKSGVLNKMTIVSSELNGAAFTYAYYQSNVAGTQNRITNIVLVDRALGAHFESQIFYYGFTIIFNGTVFYNAYDGSLGWSDEYAKRITISDIKLKTTNDLEDRGIAYTTMYEQLVNGSMMEKILKVGLSNIPKAGPFIDCFMTLTSKSDTSCGYEHKFQDTYEKQVALYGKPIRGVSAHFDKIKSLGDSVSERITGRDISSIRWLSNATYTYN